MNLIVQIGVFAHNESEGIAATLNSLLAQDIFHRPDISAQLLVLANGCSDETAARSRAVGVPVADLPLGGKSRTWNRFVHDLANPDAHILIFADADIVVAQPDALSRLALGLKDRPALQVLSSQPVKDLAMAPNLTWTERLILGSAGGLDDWKTAICGQLYAMPAPAARRFHLPIGLPVEDGFLRAMVVTDHLTLPEDLARLSGADQVRHVYASERRIGALIRHQVRIVIGSAINAAVFSALHKLPPEDRAAELETAARDEGWLPAVLGAELPRWPFGYVPPHFATKRLARLTAPGRTRSLKQVALAIAGFFFDVIVFILAQIRMALGTGAGHW